MISDNLSLSHSPFGHAPEMDLTGWCFGALLTSPTKQKIGFFIDPTYMSQRCQAYAQLVPGCSLSESVMAIALPKPIQSLLIQRSPDWEGKRQSLWTGPSTKDLASVYPYPIRDPSRNHTLNSYPRFAFLSTHSSYPGMDDSELVSTLEKIVLLWRQELESHGARCLDWQGASLTGLSNGFILDELLDEAVSSCNAAFTRDDLQRELTRTTSKQSPQRRL